MTILETERLRLRELESERDAAFIFELLNTPKFIKYIGDRNVRNAADAADIIRNRYAASYRQHGYGLYAVELLDRCVQVGICGFVRRDTLPGPDIGFAFLPDHEGKGYGLESSNAVMLYGWEKLGFEEVYAITTPDNDASGRLLDKLGFELLEVTETDGEQLKLYRLGLSN